jgi:hypothetical protein
MGPKEARADVGEHTASDEVDEGEGDPRADDAREALAEGDPYRAAADVQAEPQPALPSFLPSLATKPGSTLPVALRPWLATPPPRRKAFLAPVVLTTVSAFVYALFVGYGPRADGIYGIAAVFICLGLLWLVLLARSRLTGTRWSRVHGATDTFQLTVELSAEPVRRGQSVDIDVRVVGELPPCRMVVALVALESCSPPARLRVVAEARARTLLDEVDVAAYPWRPWRKALVHAIHPDDPVSFRSRSFATSWQLEIRISRGPLLSLHVFPFRVVPAV